MDGFPCRTRGDCVPGWRGADYGLGAEPERGDGACASGDDPVVCCGMGSGAGSETESAALPMVSGVEGG